MHRKWQLVDVKDALPKMDETAGQQLLQAFVPVKEKKKNPKANIGDLLQSRIDEQKNEQDEQAIEQLEQGVELSEQENILSESAPTLLSSFSQMCTPSMSNPDSQILMPRTSLSKERKRAKKK